MCFSPNRFRFTFLCGGSDLQSSCPVFVSPSWRSDHKEHSTRQEVNNCISHSLYSPIRSKQLCAGVGVCEDCDSHTTAEVSMPWTYDMHYASVLVHYDLSQLGGFDDQAKFFSYPVVANWVVNISIPFYEVFTDMISVSNRNGTKLSNELLWLLCITANFYFPSYV